MPLNDNGRSFDPDGDLEALFDELAALPRYKYDQRRKQVATEHDLQVGTLDKEVEARRKASNERGGFKVVDPVPWAESLDGAALLDGMTAAISRHVVMPPDAAELAALWALHTHCYECWRHTPRLAITSPGRQCGKSTLLDVLGCMVPRPVQSESLSTAVLFRVIAKHRPTVLLDEADIMLRDDDDLRACVNSGHKANGCHHRCEGDSHEIRSFPTFAPMAIAGYQFSTFTRC